MQHHHNTRHIRLIISCIFFMAWLIGCTELPVHKLLEEKGWNESDSKNIERALEDTNLFGQISLAASLLKADKKQNDIFTKPSPCIFNDTSNSSDKWNSLVDEIEKQDIINRSLPLNAEQRAEALELVTSGKAKTDIKSSLANIAEFLYGLKSSGAQKIVADLTNTNHTKALIDAIAQDIRLRTKEGLGRKHLLDNTAKVINSGAIGSIVSDTVKIFINQDNKTMRFAIIAYARMNGINITEKNLDDLAIALDKDNPDFYPLLAGAMDTMKKEYGIQDLTDKVNEIKHRDQECRPRLTN